MSQSAPTTLLPGALDLLIRKVVSPGSGQGYGRLRQETEGWARLVAVMAAARSARPEEV